MYKLTSVQLVWLNQKVVGDDHIIVESEKLKQIQEISNIPYEETEELFYRYKGTVEKAAKLGTLIATRKPFEGKNSETAVLAMLTLMEMNGFKMVDYQEHIRALMIYLEQDDKEETERWLERYMDR